MPEASLYYPGMKVVAQRDVGSDPIRGGDSEALRRWFEQEVDGVYASVGPLVGFDPARAEEVVFETFDEALSLTMAADRGTRWDAERLRVFSRENIGDAAGSAVSLERPRMLWDQFDPALRLALADSDLKPLPGLLLERTEVRGFVAALLATLPPAHLDAFLRHRSADVHSPADAYSLDVVAQCISTFRRQFWNAVEPQSAAPVRNEQVFHQNIERLLASIQHQAALDPGRRAAMLEALQTRQAVLLERTRTADDPFPARGRLPFWVPLGILASLLFAAGLGWMAFRSHQEVRFLQRSIQPMMMASIQYTQMARKTGATQRLSTTYIFRGPNDPKLWGYKYAFSGLREFPGRLTPFIDAHTEHERLQKSLGAQHRAFQAYDQSFQQLVLFEFAAMSTAFHTCKGPYPGEQELLDKQAERLRHMASDISQFQETTEIFLAWKADPTATNSVDAFSCELKLFRTKAEYTHLTNHLASSRSAAVYFLRGEFLNKHWSLLKKKFKLMELQAEFGAGGSASASIQTEIAAIEAEIDTMLAAKVTSFEAEIRELERICGTPQPP